MLLLFLTLSTSMIAMLGTWQAVQWYAPAWPGVIPSAFAAAMLVALWWGRGHVRMARAAERERVGALARSLRLWGSLQGPAELLLCRIGLAAERRQAPELGRLLEEATQRDLGPFARAWSAHLLARVENDPTRALETLRAAIPRLQGLDCAEACCEAVLCLVQLLGLEQGVRAQDDALRVIIEYLNAADTALHAAPSRGAWRTRRRYVEAFHAGARGLCYAAQGRPVEAGRKLTDAITRLRSLGTVRAVRLAALLQVERLVATRPVLPAEQFGRELHLAAKQNRLPLVERRIVGVMAAAFPAGMDLGLRGVIAGGAPTGGPAAAAPLGASAEGSPELGPGTSRPRRGRHQPDNPSQTQLFMPPVIEPPGAGEGRR